MVDKQLGPQLSFKVCGLKDQHGEPTIPHDHNVLHDVEQSFLEHHGTVSYHGLKLQFLL